MSKGSILTCGYMNFNTTSRELKKLGYELVRLGKKDIDKLNKVDNDLYIIEDHMWQELLDDEIKNFPHKISLGVMNVFGSGGVSFCTDNILEEIYKSSFFGSIVSVNATYRYIVDAHKRHKFIGFLLHSSEGVMYRTLTEFGKTNNIPTFCCYNGSIADCSPIYTASKLYENADYYYLHGDYDIDWMLKRGTEYVPDKMIKIGQPSFDSYYTKGKIKAKKVEDHTFLYSPALVYSNFDLDTLYPEVTAKIDTTSFAVFQEFIPSTTDLAFFKAFATYQREFDPSAKLLVSLRPFFGTTERAYSTYIKSIGVSNFEVCDHARKPLRDLFNETRYVVSASSTVLIEAIVNRKALLNLTGVLDMSVFPFPENFCVRCRVDNVDNLVGAISELVLREEEIIRNCEDVVEYYNFKDDGKASKRLVKDLDNKLQQR